MSILVSAGDSVVAKLIKEAGFDGCWVSGFEACVRLGLPDNGSITMTEMLNICKPIVEVGLPVYVDVDTGYGNFKRTVREFAKIGVTGICVEDNIPELKQNSLWGEKIPIMDMYEFGRKINVPHHKIEIIARTEALIREYDDAFTRLFHYRYCGADRLFPHSRTQPLQVPNDNNNWVIAPTKFPQYTNHKLKNMGYNTIIWANQTERVKIKATREMLAQLKINDRMLEAEKDLCATLDDMKGLMENE